MIGWSNRWNSQLPRSANFQPIVRNTWLGVLEDFAAANVPVYQLSAKENALIDTGVADIKAGRIVSDADMAAFWDRHKS